MLKHILEAIAVKTWWIECQCSGAGQEFVGTYNEAVKAARKFRRHPKWKVCLWTEDNRKIAEV